jgi:UDP-N-acetylmuramate: L-alanyl-gamma-D-glutamyl-meso-diaminopimelate ligase
LGIQVHEGYDGAHLEPAPDQVVIGNVIRQNNPEAIYVRDHGLPFLSMPQAVAAYGIGDRHSIVMAGTHGKTTTTALVAHLLSTAGLSPGFLIGGAPVGGGPQAAMGTGPYFVVEGDEYDTAYFDKGPKFLHYRAKTAVITSLEFDHADIFKDVAAIQAAFAALMAQVPEDGTLVVWRGAKLALELIAANRPTGRTLLYDVDPQGDCPLFMRRQTTSSAGLAFEAVLHGQSLGPMQVPLWGAHSALNVLAALGAVADLNLPPNILAQGFQSFRGIRRRMEVVYDHGITVVDDFGHHPTAVTVTLAAARQRFAGRRLWAVFEPRSATSRRRLFEDAYVQAFGGADHVLVAHHKRLTEIDEAERFSPERVAQKLLQKHVDACALPTPDAIVDHLMGHVLPGDVIIVLSNGDFDGLIPKLTAALAQGRKAG